MAAFFSSSSSVPDNAIIAYLQGSIERRGGRKFSERVAELRLPVSLGGFWAGLKLSWGGGKKLCFFERIAHMLRTV